MPVRRRITVLGIAFLTVIVLSSCSSQSQATSDPDPIARRVDILLRQMTVEDKVGQMTQVSVSRLWGDCHGQPGSLQLTCMKALLADAGVGSVLSGGGEAPQPNTPEAWATMTNTIQRYAVEHSRLHVPILYGADAVHGHNNVLGATIFPQNIGMAASWDPGLVQQVAGATATDVRRTGIHWDFAPVSDVARDIRWGRYYETFGEDPYLAAAMVASEVRGLQGSSHPTGVASTAKHYVGYSGSLTGADRTAADIPLRELRETFLPTFQAAIHAGTIAVMASSGSVNGVPVHASHYLLTDVLRHQLGFQGFVVSDWQDIESLYDRYHVATSYDDAIRMAIMAGVDMSMVPYDAAGFAGRLAHLVREGKIPMARIDQAVRRILTAKAELGLFQHPYVNTASSRAVKGAHSTLARRAAGESLTLLKNQRHVLPLHGVHSILVAGSVARSLADQMGGWTIGWQGVPDGINPPGTTILDGIKKAARARGRDVRVSFAGESNPGEAARRARQADAAVVVIGERPYAEGLGDSETAGIPRNQMALFNAVRNTGVPIVLVVVAGRPLMIGDLIVASRATVMAWLPGSEAGDAVGDVLFGDRDPSGHLPVSLPRSIGQLPLVYTAPATTASSPHARYYPLFPFGYGLSYTSFGYSDLRATVSGGAGGTVRVSITVRNTGPVAGDAVVQVYGHPDDSPVLVPPLRLVGFTRVHLGPGEAKRVLLSTPLRELAVIPRDILGTAPAEVVPGHYTIMAGAHSAEFSLP